LHDSICNTKHIIATLFTSLIFIIFFTSTSPLSAQVGGYNWVYSTQIPITNGDDEEQLISSVAMSADGSKIVATVNEGYIYVSNDSGVTWITSTSAGSRKWSSVAMTPDGNKIVAAVKLSSPNGVGGYIYVSSDGGQTWNEREYGGPNPFNSAENQGWNSVAISEDGQRIVAAATLRGTYISNDGGVTFVASSSSVVANQIFSSVVMSADGNKLAAVRDSTSSKQVFLSIDGGVTWTISTTSGTRRSTALAMTPDGTKIVVGGYLDNTGFIHASTDNGLTWTDSTPTIFTNLIQIIDAVAMSADGSKIVATVNEGYIYVSNDSGVTWVQVSTIANPSAFDMSSDGTKIVQIGRFNDNRVYIGSLDLAHPVRSSVSSNIASSSFSLSFSTNELATSVFSWGLKNYSQSTTTISTSSSFLFNIANLVSCTSYEYTLASSDIWNNTEVSEGEFFTTGCPGDSNVATSTSSYIDQEIGGSVSLDDLTIQLPVSYASTSTVYR